MLSWLLFYSISPPYSAASLSLTGEGAAASHSGLSWLHSVLQAIMANPNLALIIFFTGVLLICFECNSPATVIPGVIGVVLILVSVAALYPMPVRHSSLILLAVSVLLLLIDSRVSSYGLIGFAFLLTLSWASVRLIEPHTSTPIVSPALAVALSISLGLVLQRLLRLSVRARRAKFQLGPAALVGAQATVLMPVLPVDLSSSDPPSGRILVRGEIWPAISLEPLQSECKVIVTGTHPAGLLVKQMS